MMVSKIAVVALVAIVACPILLGYAMNLEETTKTGYDYAGQPINLTNQLINGSQGSEYSYAHGDINKMNTEFYISGSYSAYTRTPHYQTVSDQYSSYALHQKEIVNQTYSSYSIDLTNYKFYYIEFTERNVGVTYYTTSGGIEQYAGYSGNTFSIYVDHSYSGSWTTAYAYGGSTIGISTANGNLTRIVINSTGTTNGYYAYNYFNNLSPPYVNDNYIDFSSGYYLTKTDVPYNRTEQWPSITLPDSTKQFTMTMNLDSITDPNYALHINLAPNGLRTSTLPYTNLPIELAKTTTDGVAKWTLRNENDSSAAVTELITDPSISDNTYQFTFSADSVYDQDAGKYNLVFKIRASYVGSWPTLIGIANSYNTQDLEYVVRDDSRFIYNDNISSDDLLYNDIFLKADNAARTPIMRVDDALFRAFSMQTITDRVFLPTQFAQNPGVTLNNIKLIGSSIYVGGTTFAVTDGKINVNGVATNVNDLTFNFIDNGDTTYTLKIGGKVYSTNVTDTSMKLGGSWSANVTVQSMDTYTYTTTEWVPGHFGWDGIDQNFLIVGLITCLGVFIALGIYARKRGTGGLIPLMIVTGCAAAVFFIML